MAADQKNCCEKGKSLMGILNEQQKQRAIEIMQSGKITADKYVNHVFPLDRVKEAFEIAMNPHESIKVMIEP